MGSGHFEVINDHANLRWLDSVAEGNAKAARWAAVLSEANFTLTWRKGEEQVGPDTLSRLLVARMWAQEEAAQGAFEWKEYGVEALVVGGGGRARRRPVLA